MRLCLCHLEPVPSGASCAPAHWLLVRLTQADMGAVGCVAYLQPVRARVLTLLCHVRKANPVGISLQVAGGGGVGVEGVLCAWQREYCVHGVPLVPGPPDYTVLVLYRISKPAQHQQQSILTGTRALVLRMFR
jgi:hypothetical protein